MSKSAIHQTGGVGKLLADLRQLGPDDSEIREKAVAAASTIEHQLSVIGELREALGLALKILEPNEPGDSRAVSNEFVAMAAVHAGVSNPECGEIIRKALSHPIIGDKS